MDNHKEQLLQLKRLTLANYLIIACPILGTGYWIGNQTHHQLVAGQIVVFFLVAGLVCAPMVCRTSQLRLEKFRKYHEKRNEV